MVYQVTHSGTKISMSISMVIVSRLGKTQVYKILNSQISRHDIVYRHYSVLGCQREIISLDLKLRSELFSSRIQNQSPIASDKWSFYGMIWFLIEQWIAILEDMGGSSWSREPFKSQCPQVSEHLLLIFHGDCATFMYKWILMWCKSVTNVSVSGIVMSLMWLNI